MRRFKKEENNISTMKTHQMPNKWQYLTCIKVSLSKQNFQNDIGHLDCNMPMTLA